MSTNTNTIRGSVAQVKKSRQPDPNDVCERMCPSCPWQPGSKWAGLVPELTLSALTTTNRICHSTGPRNSITTRPGKPAKICRGARDVQLAYFNALGVIEAPTDAAWRKALEPRA